LKKSEVSMGNYVGKPLGRLEGFRKVSGEAKYAGDYDAPDMLHLVLVRAGIAHGYIKKIDAGSVPSDAYVFTAADLSENIVEDIIEDQPVLVKDKVRFLGEPIAIVADNDLKAAKSAAKSVKIEYEPLPAVTDALTGRDPETIWVHEKGNVLGDFKHEKGNVEKAFKECDLILEDDFYTPVQDHGCMEPEAAFAYIGEDGRLTIYTSTQNVFHDQRMISRALGLDMEQIHVKAATVGGGFGGKDGHTAQIFTAMATWLTKRPARLVFDRKESLMTTYKRHSALMHVRMGFTAKGDIRAFDGQGYLDTGAYAGLGPAVLGLFSEHFAGPYAIPDVRIESWLVYTNKPPAHAMRGFGAPQGAFATESLINRAAVILKIDPIALRYRNALEKNSIGALNQRMNHCVGFKEALKLIENSKLWRERCLNTDPYIGYGVAGGHLSCGLGKNIPDTAKVEIIKEPSGHFTLKIGFVDIGQGSATALQAMAADELGVPIENITLIMADTDQTYDCGSTAGSRSTFIAGNAMLETIKNYRKGIKATGSARFPESDKELGVAGFPHAMYTFIAQAVKLRIDPVTAKVELLDIVTATEAGKIINPLSMEGQMQGGVAMSVGYALGENCIFEDGMLKNTDFSTYLMPTAMDIPHIECLAVEAYESSGPMGVKGAAEVATVSIAPAIGAAISQVSKAQLKQLPYDIETILKQMNGGKSQ